MKEQNSLVDWVRYKQLERLDKFGDGFSWKQDKECLDGRHTKVLKSYNVKIEPNWDKIGV